MPWITNVSYKDIELGDYPDADVLIQIVCPSMEFPLPKRPVAEIQQFHFLDLERNELPELEDAKITDIQAPNIILVLQRALEGNKNVLVHCVAGANRSGAVVDVGVTMGFEDTDVYRSPNLLVKHKLLKALGIEYDLDEPFYVVYNQERISPIIFGGGSG